MQTLTASLTYTPHRLPCQTVTSRNTLELVRRAAFMAPYLSNPRPINPSSSSSCLQMGHIQPAGAGAGGGAGGCAKAGLLGCGDCGAGGLNSTGASCGRDGGDSGGCACGRSIIHHGGNGTTKKQNRLLTIIACGQALTPTKAVIFLGRCRLQKTVSGFAPSFFMLT